ncbi:MAG: excisionase family DNA-binding protein [Chloroflexota bacterium]
MAYFLPINVNYFTLGMAAKEIGVHKVTLWRWIRDGKLETYRVGREVLIGKDTVERLKQERTQ